MIFKRAFSGLLTICALSIFSVQFSLADSNLSAVTNFDSDTTGDLSVYSYADGVLTTRSSKSKTFKSTIIGKAGAIPVLGDFDGDRKADKASFHPATKKWRILYATGVTREITFGTIGAIPVPGRYSDASCTDLAFYNPRNRTWTIKSCVDAKQRSFTLGKIGDEPLAADLDCDGLDDPTLFRPADGTWRYKSSKSKTTIGFKFGLPGDIPFVADFTKDGCVNATVYRPEGNFFHVSNARRKLHITLQWGIPGDLPAIVNINGGAADFAVFRPSEAAYYIWTDKKTFARVQFKKPQPTYNDIIAPIEFEDINWSDPNFGGIGDILGSILDGLLGDFSSRSTSAALASAIPRSVEIAPASLPVPLTSPGTARTKVPGSYNGTKNSDLVVVRNTAEQKIWSIRHYDNTTSSYVFGHPSDRMLVPGDYNGNGTTQPGIIKVKNGLLNWTTRTSNGRTKSEAYGLETDKPLAGDFDCDGKSDKAVARSDGTFLHWFVKLSAGNAINGKIFGFAADQYFASDIDGDGCDELVVAQDHSGGIWWFSYSFKSKKQRGPIQWGLSGDTLLGPMDFNGDGFADIIISRPTPLGGRAFFIREFKSKSPWSTYIELGLATDVPLTGFFNGQNVAEAAVYRPGQNGAASTFYVRAPNGVVHTIPFGLASDSPLRPDGKLAQSNSNGVTCDINSDFNDGKNGALWKPVSESRGTPVILLPSRYWNAVEKINVYGREGNYITKGVHRSCCPNGGRAHFDILQGASSLAQYNPLTVQLELKNGVKECRIVPDARSRHD